MYPTRLLRAVGPRTPMIKFLGKRAPPKAPLTPESPAAEPHPHPASPSHSLPDSFMAYRSKAQQHGPLGGHNRSETQTTSNSHHSAPLYGAWGGRSGHELGSVAPEEGKVWDRSDLPARFKRLDYSSEEMEAIELGGAGLSPGWGGA